MIVLERLFILSFHFFLVASGDNNTTSFYQGINTTVLSSTINVSPITSIQVQYYAGSASTVQPPASGLLSADDSIVTRRPNDKLDYSSVLPIFTNISPTSSTEVQNNASSSTTGQPTAKGLPNVDSSIVNCGPNEKLDYSSYEENSAFFSKNLAQRLRAWNNTLKNASRQCIKELIKLKICGNVTEESVEIKFPVFQTKDIDLEAEFLTLETVHPVLVREKSGHDLVNVAYLSILELWPLLVLCFTCAALSGMILWFLDHRSNSEQFPRRFWRGIFDGMWWAIVTMTTVGYGDKAPKSLFARLFATVWMITGIILLSMFTAQVSSRLTAQELKSDDHLFGKTIGVPPGLYDSDYVDYEMTSAIIEEITEPIESVSVLTAKGLDSMVAFHCNDKEASNDSWEVIQFLPLCKIGVSLFVHNESIEIETKQKFFNCMTAKIASETRKNRTGVLGKQNNKVKESKSCQKLLKQLEGLKFEFKWVYFKNLPQYLIPFGAVLGTILLAFIAGTVWDCCSKDKEGKRYTKKGLEEGLMAQTSFVLKDSTQEESESIAVAGKN